MDTGQLAMLFTPLASSGQLAGPQSASVSDQPQPDVFAGLFAAMVADSIGASRQVGGEVAPCDGDAVTAVQFPVGATMVPALPAGMEGSSLRVVTSSDRSGKSIDDKTDTADTTDMANTGLVGAMLVQPAVLPAVCPQRQDVTEQNAPPHVLDAINSVATSAQVAATNPYPSEAATVPDVGDAATTVREAVQGTTLLDTPVGQPNQLLQEVGKEAPSRKVASDPAPSLPDDGQGEVRGAGQSVASVEQPVEQPIRPTMEAKQSVVSVEQPIRPAMEVKQSAVSVEQPIRPTMEVGQAATVRMASAVGNAVSSSDKVVVAPDAEQQPGQSPVYVRQDVSSNARPATVLPKNTEATGQGVPSGVVVSDRFGLQPIQQPDVDRGRIDEGAEAVRSADAGVPVRDSVRSAIPAGVALADSQHGHVSKPEWVQGKNVLPAPTDAGQVETADVKPGATISDKRSVVETVTVVSGQKDLQQPVEIPEQGGQARDAVESKLVRSVAVGTTTVGHQAVAPTTQEPVAKGSETGMRIGQVVASGVAAQVDSFNPGTSGDEAGDLDRHAAQETPQPPEMRVSAGHQQTAFNGAEALTQTTGVANQPEQSKVEQGRIVNQVKEQLATHEVKQGSEQITLRLSPQNLGDIQVNLRLDNQQLKVEIVAQNHTVRDALMQNTDSLKESLARQNISMESFDVTTGGNSGFQQGSSADWKQLAQQRQVNPWMPSGYHAGGQEEVLRSMPVYLARQEHAMVDLHF